MVLTATAPGAPLITVQPVSQTVDFGSSVTFSVTATGATPLQYQWYQNAIPITGAKGPAHTIDPVTLYWRGTYTVTVKNNLGTATSKPATLTVRALDFGDAPDALSAPGYPTYAGHDGARHLIEVGFYLGHQVDPEVDGQPAADATGDDTQPETSDDEDGVRFLDAPIPGATVRLEVRASGAGRLDAWVDFNRNGTWADAGEQVFTSALVATGVNSVSFVVPTTARLGETFARFRLSRGGGLKFDGLAPDGEVEDYRLVLGRLGLDFGDAPDPAYPTTLKTNGARHAVEEGYYLGTRADVESDGQPNADATGDDGAVGGADDEDGVRFLDPLIIDTLVRVEVTASAPGLLDAWIDFDQNGSWAEGTDQVFQGMRLAAGVNEFTVYLNQTLKAGPAFARFRFSRQGGLRFDGPAPDGEVEDYQLSLVRVPSDYGDAPDFAYPEADPLYPTLRSNLGARHLIQEGFYLGARVDAEADGQPNADATGDDLNPTAADDEDGVKFLDALVPGETVRLEVTASSTGRLDAWVDFDGDGSWSRSDEQIFRSEVLIAGTRPLSFVVPATAELGETFARFRLSREGGLEPDGLARDGEVEDYQVTIGLTALDYGDAPDPAYPTLALHGGASHILVPGFYLGLFEDGEPDGQPNADATGDDGLAGARDDEDGVKFLTPLTAGQNARVEVTASSTGYLDAWVDFNLDADWADEGEQIFRVQLLAGGPNLLSFAVPANATAGATFARFRFSLQGGLRFAGAAPDGEVEDYRVTIEQPPPCNPSSAGADFWLTFPGNYAPDPANPVRISLCIVGDRDTAGWVEIADLGFRANFVIPPAGLINVPLPAAAELGDANDLIEKKGIHVTASAPVSVYGMNQVRFTSDGYLALPTSVLGREYIVQAYRNVHTAVPELDGTQFALVATEDNTTVTIIPAVVTGARDSGVPYDLTMSRGQTYQLRCESDAPYDLSGTIITADKPVSVFGSHRCANVNSTDVFFCDYLVEHLPPVETWGREFVTLPLATRSGGDTFRCLAAVNDTHVSINGVRAATLNRGQSHETILAAGAVITADQPLLVTQYASSSDFDGVVNSDPFMVLAPPTRMHQTSYRFCVAGGDFAAGYVHLIVPNAIVGAVSLDGAAIPAGQFAAIGASGYSGARVGVAPGAHSLAGALRFGAVVYGWAQYESYAWPAGLFFGDTVPPTLTCPPDFTVNVPVGTAGLCRVPVPDLRPEVEISDDCGLPEKLVLTQDPAPGTLVGAGVHSITVSATDVAGNVGSCQTRMTVIDPRPITLSCPNDMTIRCTGPAGAVVTYEAFARNACGDHLPVECTPPSGRLFPPGVTTVTCRYDDTAGPLTCSFTVTLECRRVEITLTREKAAISWTSEGALESATEITGPWTVVPDAKPPFTVRPEGTRRFFRVRE